MHVCSIKIKSTMLFAFSLRTLRSISTWKNCLCPSKTIRIKMSSWSWLWGSSSQHSHRDREHKPLSKTFFFLFSIANSISEFLLIRWLSSFSNRITAKLTLFEVTGLATNRPAPTLLSSRKAATKDGNPLLFILFETNPLDESANQRLYVESEPLEIIYDAVSDGFHCVYVCVTKYVLP